MDSSNTPWLMFGLACSMPWNAMITSTNFYEQELANRHDLFNIFESGISVCYLACNLISFIVIQVMGPPRHAVAIRTPSLVTLTTARGHRRAGTMTSPRLTKAGSCQKPWNALRPRADRCRRWATGPALGRDTF